MFEREEKEHQGGSAVLDGDDAHDAETGKEDSDTIESIASELGWYEKEGGKTAKQFLLDSRNIQKSLKDELKKVTRSHKNTIKGLQEQISNLETNFSKSGKDEVGELRKKIREAAQEGDDDLVDKLTDKLLELNSKKSKPEQDNPKQFEKDVREELGKAFAKWQRKNQWYNDDDGNEEKIAAADLIYRKLLKEFDPEEEDAEDLFERLDERLQEKFSKSNGKKLNPSGDLSNSRISANGKKSVTFADIKDPQVRAMAKKFQSQGALAQYGKSPEEQLNAYARNYFKEGGK